MQRAKTWSLAALEALAAAAAAGLAGVAGITGLAGRAGGATTAEATTRPVPTAGNTAVPAPDLSITVQGPSSVGIDAPFTETATVTNEGTASTPGVTVSYSTGTRAISPGAAPAGLQCTYVLYGHSGRGGGVTVVGQSCNDTLAAGLAPGQSVTIALSVTEVTAESLTLGFAAAPYPAATQLNVVSHAASTSFTAIRPPAAAAPTAVRASQTGDQLNVTWTPDPATAPYIISSAITATPSNPNKPTLSATVSGQVTSAVVPNVLGSTVYKVTVVNNDAGGTGATSQPFFIESVQATIPPGAPTITHAWGYGALSWVPTSFGNSVINGYQVLATGGGQRLTTYVAGTVLTAYLYPQPADLLSVKVRAHNGAGWSPWSTPVTFVDGGGG
jgi:hypothetical protein